MKLLTTFYEPPIGGGLLSEMRNKTMTLEVTVQEFPARHLTGMVVRTNMQKASIDCPAIWQTFGPRLVSFPNSTLITEAYGVSFMVGTDGTFDYWAAAETPANAPVPDDMKTIELPAGLYACTFAPNLEQMEMAYQEIYTEWSKRQTEYVVDMQAPCAEVYRTGWQPSEPFELWVPVIPAKVE